MKKKSSVSSIPPSESGSDDGIVSDISGKKGGEKCHSPSSKATGTSAAYRRPGCTNIPANIDKCCLERHVLGRECHPDGQSQFEEYPMGLKFRIIHEQFECLMTDELKEENLTYSQMIVLKYLAHNRDHKVTPKELSAAINVTQPTITGILRRMAEKGLIVQTEDPSNRRYHVITIGPEGEKTIKEHENRREEKDVMLIRNMTQEEISTLNHLLRKVHDNLADEIAAAEGKNHS